MWKRITLVFCLLLLTAPCLLLTANASQNPLAWASHQSGATVDSNIQNALDSLNTIQSGATAPASAAPYSLWADTGNALLKQRNAANNAWIVVGTLGAAYLGLQPALPSGTSTQYLRGDLTMQTLNLGALGFTAGTGATDLLQLDGSGAIPSGVPVPAANLTGTLGHAHGGTDSTAAPNTANGVVVLDSSGRLPAANASQLTNIPAPTLPVYPASGGIVPGNFLTIDNSGHLIDSGKNASSFQAAGGGG